MSVWKSYSIPCSKKYSSCGCTRTLPGTKILLLLLLAFDVLFDRKIFNFGRHHVDLFVFGFAFILGLALDFHLNRGPVLLVVFFGRCGRPGSIRTIGTVERMPLMIAIWNVSIVKPSLVLVQIVGVSELETALSTAVLGRRFRIERAFRQRVNGIRCRWCLFMGRLILVEVIVLSCKHSRKETRFRVACRIAETGVDKSLVWCSVDNFSKLTGLLYS